MLHPRRAVLDASGGGLATRGWPHHPRPPRPPRADRALRPASRPAGAAGRSRQPRRADGSRLRVPERHRAARARAPPPGGGLDQGAALQRARAPLPPRHRLHRGRQRPRVPLPRVGARARRRAPRHPLPRAGPRARAARRLREVPAMIHAALLAGLSALLGGAIALLARRHPAVLERTRTFAFAAAAGVVAFHLLPEVIPALGLVALLWMAMGFALPWLLEWGARTLGPGLLRGRGLSGQRVSAEVGFAALLFHSVAEGLALVAALAQPRGKLDLEAAIVAHHAPLTAAVVLPFLDLGGPRAAALRAALVAAAGVAGVLLSGTLPGFSEGAFLQAATAVTAGALLHVVSDEIRTQRFASPLERALDLGACAAGLLVAGIGAALNLREGAAAAPVVGLLRVF